MWRRLSKVGSGLAVDETPNGRGARAAQEPKLCCQIEIVPLSERHTGLKVADNGVRIGKTNARDVSRFMPFRFMRLHSHDPMLLGPQNSRPENAHRELRISKLTTAYRGKRTVTDPNRQCIRRIGMRAM